MARRQVERPKTIIVDGRRVGSPYIQMVEGHYKCLPCNVWLQTPEHLKKLQHRNKAWHWCFGCNEAGRRRQQCNAELLAQKVEPLQKMELAMSPFKTELLVQQMESHMFELRWHASELLVQQMESHVLELRIPVAQLWETMAGMKVSIGDIQTNIFELKEGMNELMRPQTMEKEEKTQTLEFKALDEHKNSWQEVIVAQQSMQKQIQELKGQATMIETVVNSMCPRGRALRGRDGGLASSASAGSLPGPPCRTELLSASADAALGPAAQV
ncbi:unnamed protein product [Prorocentrum cordatum]|uniref:Uncharacterized protein n=1 Tax=Prorocentrum cordatum TaxID=2364126 RepID=A0ABN9XMY5_9DINO|nr:unnamed protein product [Polarella glacialis]